MKKLREKSEIWFAVLHIIAYVVLFSAADDVSKAMGVQKCITLPVCIIFSIVIFLFVKKNMLTEYYGLCKSSCDLKKWLYFIPLIALSTVNLWNGAALSLSIMETVLYAASMLFVGFLEEMIFRGYLFRAMYKNNVKAAIIVSGITFGMGHIVNLLNGAKLLPTLMQIVYATAIGFLFTIIFVKSGSIIPCIISHAFINLTSVIGVEPEMNIRIIFNLTLTVIAAAYADYIFKAIPNKILQSVNSEANA